MTRHFLFLLTISFAATLGALQGVPLIVTLLLGVLALWLIAITHRWWLAVVYLVVGVGLAWVVMVPRLHQIQFQPGQTISFHGLVTKSASTESWIKVQDCREGTCVSGVLLPESIELGLSVEAWCELLPLPQPTTPWRWWKQGIAASCNPLSRIQHHQSTGIGWLYRLRLQLRQRIDQAFAPRQAGLLSGILFGDTSSMPTEVAVDFRRTGTTHIVALSGFNVTIILQSLVTGLLPLLGKRWTTIVGLLLVVVFVVATGASSSVVRAAVMAAVLQLVRFAGRPVHPDRVILLTTIVMSLQNPWLLWHDLGFQLSMTSTFGLLQLRPALEQFGKWLPEQWEVRDNALSTAAASIASAPIIIGTFGGWSLISLLANIVVLPCIPVIMGIGALSIPLLWLPESIQLFVLAPVDLLLRFVLGSLHWLAAVPWAYQLLPIWGSLLLIAGSFSMIILLYASRQSFVR